MSGPTAPVRELATLLATLAPERVPGTYVYASVADARGVAADAIVATLREAEGLSLIVEAAAAARAGLVPLARCAWLTLRVHSDLHAVGLTAAVAQSLAAQGIAANVVAGALHDHVFVPVAQADAALDALRALQARHAR